MIGISNVTPMMVPKAAKAATKSAIPAFHGYSEDVTQFSAKKPEPPKISRLRLAFGLLTKKQVDQINAAGRLPDNAKFMQNGMGGYTIHNNFFNLRHGTSTIPAGFEVRRNILGFATVQPIDTKGLFIKDK